jgi:hypothetical protein
MRRLRRRAGPVGLVLALAVLLAPSAFPMASAAFSGTTTDAGNMVSSGQVAPPADLAVSRTCTPSATITFRSATTAGGIDSLVLARPAGTVAGDVLVAQVINRGGEQGGLQVPAGWTQLTRVVSVNVAGTSSVLWRVATAGDPASWTFAITTPASAQMVGGMAAYGGVSTTDPIHASGSATGATPTATTPSIATTVANTRLLHLFAKREDLPAPVGTTQRWRVVTGPAGATAGSTLGDEPFAGPGATPARSTTTGVATEWVAHAVALRPIPGTPTANLTWTASSTSSATGYTLERLVGATPQATKPITPITATATSDGPLVNGTTYTFRLRAYQGTWNSTVASASLTPSC